MLHLVCVCGTLTVGGRGPVSGPLCWAGSALSNGRRADYSISDRVSYYFSMLCPIVLLSCSSVYCDCIRNKTVILLCYRGLGNFRTI